MADHLLPSLGTFEHMADFDTLLYAHAAARKGKRKTRAVMEFQMDLAANLWQLHEELTAGAYKPGPYAHFVVREPKVRQVFAPPYRDRVVQHALCDTVLRPALDPRLVYDNAACRQGKGTHFALDRLAGFMREHFRRHGHGGYVLRCDVRHYFASIRHDEALGLLARVFGDERIMVMLERIVTSYEESPGVGLPLGNQTSQWLALVYLDSLDRLIKERLSVRYYTRYMDDAVLIHPSKEHLRRCLEQMIDHLAEIGLSLNAKTQIFPLTEGVSYLGFHSRLTPTGSVVRRVSHQTSLRMRRRVKMLTEQFAAGEVSAADVRQSIHSYVAHLDHGATFAMRQAILSEASWSRGR
ncbi:MAG: reverse transcriptase/maturase family protein [Micrococcales bacterium]|nr:reverse transcriptase/maturase family protein [Micrococcales bacterium]